MRPIALLPALVLAGCASPSLQEAFQPGESANAPTESAPAESAAPEARTEAAAQSSAPAPQATASTPEELDTTTEEERAAATAEPQGGGQQLGTTLATLGSPNESGIWLRTPLVGSVTPGRVTYRDNSYNVELRPSGGAAGSGSQISLPAMRLIGVPLTEIVELTVYTR